MASRRKAVSVGKRLSSAGDGPAEPAGAYPPMDLDDLAPIEAVESPNSAEPSAPPAADVASPTMPDDDLVLILLPGGEVIPAGEAPRG
jgi:hypothetical protein